MIPTLLGQTVARIECESYLDLLTSEGGALRIENDYALEQGDRRLTTEAGEESEIVAALQSLAGEPITGFQPTGSGGLVLTVGAARLTVEAHPDFEAWEIVGPRQERIISGPGGRLSIWSLDD